MVQGAFSLLVLASLWVAIGLFYRQYRACCAVDRREARLKKKNDEMNCFVYGAAHDLKAPLRAIMQISERLLGDNGAVSAELRKSDLVLLRQRAARMSVLIDDLLAYWQAGQCVVHAHGPQTDMAALTREVIAMLSPPPGFVFSLDASLGALMVDRAPMRQILMNLIGNAIKHHGGARGVVRIGGADRGRDYCVWVADDGQGVPDAYKETIFEPFATLKPRDEVEGSGLGLALVKRILERQRGAIRVSDGPEGGAVFQVTWPKTE